MRGDTRVIDILLYTENLTEAVQEWVRSRLKDKRDPEEIRDTVGTIVRAALKDVLDA